MNLYTKIWIRNLRKYPAGCKCKKIVEDTWWIETRKRRRAAVKSGKTKSPSGKTRNETQENKEKKTRGNEKQSIYFVVHITDCGRMLLRACNKFRNPPSSDGPMNKLAEITFHNAKKN